jgi:AraC family transcriptional regulator of adaptative response/methylated-DNA-[protein]-cysteine methyltransferase
MYMSTRKTRLAATIQADARWASVLARDVQADGKFFFAVKTTGVYCRPSCAARVPRPENVQFFSTRDKAELAGFRPCKRCQPDRESRAEQNAARIASVCRLIEESEEAPKLKQMASLAGLSPYYFHRVFREVTGLTPREYTSAQREQRVRQELANKETVTEAIYEAGYNSSGRFYEAANRVLGMTPTSYRAGGVSAEMRVAVGECSLGSILVAQSARGVCAILLGDDPDQLMRDLQNMFPRANVIAGDREFEQLVSRVVGFVEKPDRGLDLPLDLRGTAFQQRVWQALRKIPFGSTVSYTDLARKLGKPKSVRAVAQACAANRLAVAIPCHRVVRNDGGLSGYRWGVERKRELLKREVGT